MVRSATADVLVDRDATRRCSQHNSPCRSKSTHNPHGAHIECIGIDKTEAGQTAARQRVDVGRCVIQSHSTTQQHQFVGHHIAIRTIHHIARTLERDRSTAGGDGRIDGDGAAIYIDRAIHGLRGTDGDVGRVGRFTQCQTTQCGADRQIGNWPLQRRAEAVAHRLHRQHTRRLQAQARTQRHGIGVQSDGTRCVARAAVPTQVYPAVELDALVCTGTAAR